MRCWRCCGCACSAQHLHRLRRGLGGQPFPRKLLLLGDACLLGLLLELNLAMRFFLLLHLRLLLGFSNAGLLSAACLSQLLV